MDRSETPEIPPDPMEHRNINAQVGIAVPISRCTQRNGGVDIMLQERILPWGKGRSETQRGEVSPSEIK